MHPHRSVLESVGEVKLDSSFLWVAVERFHTKSGVVRVVFDCIQMVNGWITLTTWRDRWWRHTENKLYCRVHCADVVARTNYKNTY